MERDSFVVYKSFLSAIKRLKRRDIQGELALAIIEYGITGVMTECGEIVELAMELIKPQIEANNQKYLNGKKGAEHGKKGGRPKKENPEKPQENPNETPNEDVNDNVNVNDISFLEKKKQKIQTLETGESSEKSESQEPETKSQEANENPDLKTEKELSKKVAAKKVFNFSQAMIDAGFDPELSAEWLKIRKAKKAVNSELAFKNFLREVEKSGRSPNEVLALVVQKQWKGFEASWLHNEQFTNVQRTISNEQRAINNNPEPRIGRTTLSEIKRGATGWE